MQGLIDHNQQLGLHLELIGTASICFACCSGAVTPVALRVDFEVRLSLEKHSRGQYAAMDREQQIGTLEKQSRNEACSVTKFGQLSDINGISMTCKCLKMRFYMLNQKA